MTELYRLWFDTHGLLSRIIMGSTYESRLTRYGRGATWEQVEGYLKALALQGYEFGPGYLDWRLELA